MQPIFKND